jgi:tetratricopeptide (TPR) repeat protein
MAKRATQGMDVAALERALEQTESADAEAHKLYNNLGLAYATKGNHHAALRAHREEKRACRRLAAEQGASAERLVDLAIAYRRCGDATLKVDRLVHDPTDEESSVSDDDQNVAIITERTEIANRAYNLHVRALGTAEQAAAAGVRTAVVEVQAAYAAMAHSALALALESKEMRDFGRVVALCRKATVCATSLADDQAGGKKARTSMIISAAVNLAIAVSGLGDKDRARILFQAAGVRARQIGDTNNLIRCLANLAEEAGDEADWQLCLEYVDQWVALAKEQRDDGEEADALRKRGAALFELRRYDDAKSSLERALILARDNFARDEAQRNLNLVQSEIEEMRCARELLRELVTQCNAAANAGESIAEARLRLSAGEAAFRLHQDCEAMLHLERYFALVDDYGCGLAATGVDNLRHCTAVANMAEASWHCGRIGEAVQWGMRELAVYKDDVAGQAQAWCNIGIYLDDDGKFDRAQEALCKSIALAEQAGDDHLKSRAELNLKVVLANRAEKENAAVPHHTVNVDQDAAQSLENSMTPRKEDSIAVCAESTILDTPRSAILRSRSSREQDGDRSSMGMRRYVDLSSIYQKSCIAISQGHAEIPARSAVMDRLRALSARLVACDNEDVVHVDLMGCLLEDFELQPLIQTLSALPVDEPLLSLNLRLNPLFLGSSFRWLVSSGSMRPPRILPAVVEMDLSGTGLEASSLRMLARAVEPAGVLSQVKILSVANNCLGKEPDIAADSVARLIVYSNVLESFDISLNMLPNSFLGLLANNIESLLHSAMRADKEMRFVPKLRHLSLRLNNRCAPTALLESNPGVPAPCGVLRRLFRAVPSMRQVDVRACGASDTVRRDLFSLCRELQAEALNGASPLEAMDDEPFVLVVSPGVYDENEYAD